MFDFLVEILRRILAKLKLVESFQEAEVVSERSILARPVEMPNGSDIRNGKDGL